MITGELKNKIDSLWDIFAAGGLVNPLDVIEQITYLMFIHDLDDSDNLRAKEAAMLGLPYTSIFTDEVQVGERTIDGQQLKWSVFHDFPAGKMYSVMQEWVFPFIKNLHGDKNSAYSKYMDDAIFKLPTPLLLSKVVDALDEIYRLMSESQAADVRGDTYEYLLSKIAQSGLNGQFRTPRHIIRMMVELMDPKADDMICDPACGTSGFLVSAGEYLKEHRKEEIFFNRQKKDHYMNHMFFGYDMDRTMLRIGAMNMMTHGIDNPFIEYRDSLSDQNLDKEKYSLILANPPFKGSLDADTVSTDLLKVCKTKKTELLFLTLFLRMLRIGGRCACIVPDGVLFGSSTAHKAIRKELVDGNRLEAVISMPSGVFKPYAGVSTAVLIFTKTGHGGTDNVWFYDMTADGFSLDDKRSSVADNDIPDIIARFRKLEAEKNRQRTEKSFFVPKAEIVDNGYDLSINKYKKTEYKPVEYPPTNEILAELRRLEKEIGTAMDELEEKDKFYIFDFCGNFEFFRINKGRPTANMIALQGAIFYLKAQIAYKLQDLAYQTTDLIDFRRSLVEDMVRKVQELNKENFAVRQHLKYVELYAEPDSYNALTYEDTLLMGQELAPLITPEEDDAKALRFDALLYGIELAYLAGKKYGKARSDLFKKVSAVASVANIPEIMVQAELIDRILHTDYVEAAGINEFEHIRENLRDLIKYIPGSKVHYDTNFDDEILSVDWKESELENDDLKNYKAKAEFYVRQHMNDAVIAKLKGNVPLTAADVQALEKALWSEVGTKQDYEAEYGQKPLGEFVREIVGLDMNAAKEAFAQYLNDAALDSRQIYCVNQIVEYIVHNGMMKDLSVLQEPPFTDCGSIVEVFTDLSVWAGIRQVIESINANAVA